MLSSKEAEQYKRIAMVKDHECDQNKQCDDCEFCVTDDGLRYFCKKNKLSL